MIRIENVAKEYKTRKGAVGVLHDINLTVRPGEKVGILGVNGAGKSTLVRIISGVERPTRGVVHRTMSVSWPLAFTSAFQNALTGYDNVRCICRIYGIKPEEKIDQIQDFAELGRYLREPVKNYSTGMRARLAFAISMAIEFDCFLIDEVVAVGDARFQEKSRRELFEKRRDRAMIIVSHSPGYVRKHCDRAVVLNKGRLYDFPDLDSGYEFYEQMLREQEAAQGGTLLGSAQDAPPPPLAVEIESLKKRANGALAELQTALRIYQRKAGSPPDFLLPGPAPTLAADLLAGCTVLPRRADIVAQLPKGGVGVQVGRQPPAFTRTLFDTTQAAKLYLLGNKRQSAQAGPLSAELQSGRIESLDGDTDEALETLEDGSLDYAYVNVAQDYEVVRKDLHGVFRKVRSGGSIVCNNFTNWGVMEARSLGGFKAVMEEVLDAGAQVSAMSLHPYGYSDITVIRP
ncbi:ATP-binding cassette domain-containing protein [Novosphingobium profundi]|uniref:ATP-binding cassette domain-containing protein n=1 Tax=Novosphingobium profundi TaxID=1774954 RepID=UPI00299CF04C|nr:ATP-binding cassette domain-containing protein [Novosphingobium profundi]